LLLLLLLLLGLSALLLADTPTRSMTGTQGANMAAMASAAASGQPPSLLVLLLLLLLSSKLPLLPWPLPLLKVLMSTSGR
jgi:hypothetical protein